MSLTQQAVDDMLRTCLSANAEAADGALLVEGIMNSYAFDPARIAEHAEEIGAMLAELPDEFQASGGGGWSFLNACMDKHGHQWTGLHQRQEQLFALGIAAGKARWLLSRDMWSVFPGGMPYVAVN